MPPRISRIEAPGRSPMPAMAGLIEARRSPTPASAGPNAARRRSPPLVSPIGGAARSPMRIVAGRLRGRRLELPAGLDIRPTADRTRQALFDLLEHGHLRADGGSAVVDAVVLDGFAGTGALGIEALSRGAAAASFMDMSRASLDAARANAKALGLDAQFILADVTNPPRARRPAGLVFLDPPYDKALAVPALEALAAGGWIAPGAIVSLELSGRETAAFVAPAGFAKIDERRYGKARILLLRAALSESSADPIA
jgi:16S rRNA (guanine966-N2)-methyltransferase